MSKVLLQRVEELVLENNKLKTELASRDSVQVENLKFEQLKLENKMLNEQLNNVKKDVDMLSEVNTKLMNRINSFEIKKNLEQPTKHPFLGDPVKPSRLMEEIQKMAQTMKDEPGKNKWLDDAMTAATSVSSHEPPTKEALKILTKFADTYKNITNTNVISENVGDLATIAKDEKELEYFSRKLEAFNNEKSKKKQVLANKKVKTIQKKLPFKKSER